MANFLYLSDLLTLGLPATPARLAFGVPMADGLSLRRVSEFRNSEAGGLTLDTY